MGSIRDRRSLQRVEFGDNAGEEPYPLPIFIERNNPIISKSVAKVSCLVKAHAANLLSGNKINKSLDAQLEELMLLVWDSGYDAAIKKQFNE